MYGLDRLALCITVHDFRLLGFRRGCLILRFEANLCITVHDFRGNVLNPVSQFLLGRRGSGGLVDDVPGGVEPGAVRGVGFGEDGVDGGEGLGDMIFGFFADEEGLVVMRVTEGVAEEEGGTTPIGDGIAVDASGFGGRLHGCTTDDGDDDLLLNRREAVGDINVGFVHFASSDLSIEIGWMDNGVGGLQVIERAGRNKSGSDVTTLRNIAAGPLSSAVTLWALRDG
jgi:hypothetical protein